MSRPEKSFFAGKVVHKTKPTFKQFSEMPHHPTKRVSKIAYKMRTDELLCLSPHSGITNTAFQESC